MINAPTCSSFIIWLGLCVKSDTKVKLFNKFMQICKKELEEKVDTTKNDKYLCNSNWDKVAELSGINELKHNIHKPETGGEEEIPLQTLEHGLLEERIDGEDLDNNSMI